MTGLDQISVVVAGYSGVVVLGAAYAVVRLRARPSWLDSMIWFLELLAAVRAVAGVGSLLSGHRAHEPTAYVGYLLASVCIIPIAVASFRPDPGVQSDDQSAGSADRSDVEAGVEEDRGAWSVGVVAVSAVAVGIIAVRTMMTL